MSLNYTSKNMLASLHREHMPATECLMLN